MYCEFGVPHVLKSDNGSPFQSDDCEVCQLPWFQTQANYAVLAESQRRMRTLYENLGQMHQSCHRRRSFIQAKSACILAELSCDDTSNTGISPVTALFGRAIRTRLPELSVTLPDESMRQRDDFMKEKMRKYADSRLGDHRQYLDVGDKVLIPNRRKGTIEPRYSTEPHEVVHIKGSMIIAKRGDRSLTRKHIEIQNVNTRQSILSCSNI